MKKRTTLIAFLLLFCIVFSACGSASQSETDTEDLPGARFGEAATFEKDGISLLLTDRFKESESSRTLYASYAADFCSVLVSRELFLSEENLSAQSRKEYLENSVPGITVQEKDGLFYYTKDSADRRVYAYCFKGSDAFWVVQYLCWIGEAESMEGLFYQWAKGVKVR